MPTRPIEEEEPPQEAEEEEEDKNSVEECLDADFDDHIPCTWRYVANCFLLPLTNGGVNGFPWSGVALFFQLNGWPLWKLGLCSFAGFGLRVIMALLYLKVGTWVSLVTTTIHLACCVPALINPFADWAVIMEMVALLGLDSMLPNDAIVFYNYCDSETQAQKAASQVLQSLVACYATASTLGGLVYDFAGWRGCAVYHLALQMLQAFLIFTEPAVWASWAEWRHGASVSDISSDRRSTASIVPVMEPPAAGRPSGNPPSLVCDDLLPSPPKATVHVEGHCTPDPVWNGGAHRGARNSGHEQNKKSVAISRVSFAAPATRGSMLFARGSFAGRESGRVSGAGGARRSLMSRFPEMPRSSVAVKMSRRSMACGNMIPMSVPREASQLMFFAEEEEEQEEGSDVRKAVKKTIPRDILVPALLICLIGLNHNLSYQSEWTLYAVFFAEQHGWQSATWAGLAQTSGDVLGTVIMNFQSRCAVASEEDGFDGGRCRWLWYSLTAKPYTASWILLAWAILNLALTAPSLPAAVAAQVVMGTVFVLSMQAATKMNLFYSLGDGDVFLALQVMRQNFESFGSALAALVSLLLYERVHPLASFWLTAGVSLLILLLYTLTFCRRVGFGKSLDTKEEERSQRKGLVREKTWQKSTATMAATQRLSLGSED